MKPNHNEEQTLIAKYILEPGKEVVMSMESYVHPGHYETGTWLLCVYPNITRLYISENTIDSATRNMNARLWEYQDIENIPKELKIYNLLTS